MIKMRILAISTEPSSTRTSVMIVSIASRVTASVRTTKHTHSAVGRRDVRNIKNMSR